MKKVGSGGSPLREANNQRDLVLGEIKDPFMGGGGGGGCINLLTLGSSLPSKKTTYMQRGKKRREPQKEGLLLGDPHQEPREIN